MSTAGARARAKGRLALALVAASGFGAWLPAAAHADATPAQERFRAANEAARSGDYPRAIAGYRELAASGAVSASLYWNWAQAAQGQGGRGEALWALMRAREHEPGDRAVERAIERLREELSLDPAEIEPEPLAHLRRVTRRFHLDLVASALLGLSLVAHVAQRRSRASRLRTVPWASFGLGLILVLLPLLAALARPTGVVLARGAPLLDSASPNAEPIGMLREGEVVPIIAQSEGYVRIQDSSGARGWARREDLAPIQAGA